MEGEAFGSNMVAGTSDYILVTDIEGEREERRMGKAIKRSGEPKDQCSTSILDVRACPQSHAQWK